MKAYVIVEKENGKLNILCVEAKMVTAVVERDDGYEYRKIKANQVIDHVVDCMTSWGKQCRSLEEFVKTVAHAVSLVEIEGDEEVSVADVFGWLNLEEFRERLKLSFVPEEVVVCVPLRYEF